MPVSPCRRLLMRQLRARIRELTPAPLLPPEPQAPSKKDIVMEALVQTRDNVKAALNLLTGVTVDRSYVYEIKREAAGTCQRRPASSADVG